MRLLLNEMYAPALAAALTEAGIEAITAREAGVAGCSDAEVLAAALCSDAAVLTENVSDFARLASDRLAAGAHHAGVLIALSSRFSRRAAGRSTLVRAIQALGPRQDQLADRVVYLERR